MGDEHAHSDEDEFYDDIENDEEDDRMMVAFAMMGLDEYRHKYFNKRPCRTSQLQGHQYVLEVLNGHESRCFDMFRMHQNVFIMLCNELITKRFLKHSRYVTVQEQVAMFLLIIAHNERYRVVAERFQHSTETISKYFRRVLKAICRLGAEIITPPDFTTCPPEIRYNPNFYPFFKNCVGAIDGTHVSANILSNEQIPYRGRKVEPTSNVMCVCSFDMRFTYVLSGWEGTANDSRVFHETITNPANKFPLPPTDKYYLVDSGYTNMPGFLAPYRGERYHTQEYRASQRQPTKETELFNYRHSSLRNTIERCFGILKARFPILKQMPPFPIRVQKYIPTACCTIHNFIRMHAVEDSLFEGVGCSDDEEDESSCDGASTSQTPVPGYASTQALREMNRVRHEIATALWANQNVN